MGRLQVRVDLLVPAVRGTTSEWRQPWRCVVDKLCKTLLCLTCRAWGDVGQLVNRGAWSQGYFWTGPAEIWQEFLDVFLEHVFDNMSGDRTDWDSKHYSCSIVLLTYLEANPDLVPCNFIVLGGPCCTCSFVICDVRVLSSCPTVDSMRGLSAVLHFRSCNPYVLEFRAKFDVSFYEQFPLIPSTITLNLLA